jgi:thioredoxin-dependent peroxiredoxin
MSLAPGDPAPDFSASNQDGKSIRLSELRGHPVLLYFYPKDDTPGCTKEACGFRDGFEEFRKLGAIVFGVSSQDEKSHQAFRSKYALPFDLLVDSRGELSRSFEVGSIPLLGLFKRQSVLIDAQGRIARVYPDVDPAAHPSEVLVDLRRISSSK